MIKEHGCQPTYQYPHKGILGKTLGIDLIKEIISAGKEERPNEAARQRFFMNGHNTVQFRLLRTNCMTIVTGKQRVWRFQLTLDSYIHH